MNEWVELARAHASTLVVVIPFAGAALMFATPNARAAWGVASLIMLTAAVIAADFAYRTLLASPPPAEAAGAWTTALLTLLATLATFGAAATLRDFEDRAAPFALALFMAMVAAWNGAFLARSFAGLVLSVEIAWLAAVGLAALHGERDRGALTGALRMLIHGGVAAALLLVGAALTMRSLGGGSLALLASAPASSPTLAAAGLGLMLSGLALKAGVAPFHGWTGAVFGRGGGFGAMALGVVGVVGALSALVRLAAFAMSAPSVAVGVSTALLTLGLVSVVIGSVQAAGASNVRRLVAYACAAQAGCVLVSAALGSPAGFASSLVQIAALGASAMALFAGVAVLGDARDLSALDGMGRRSPLSSFALTAGCLSLMGAPLTLGFLGRWRLIEAGVGGGWWWAASAVIVVSLAAVFYGGRIIERVYFRRVAVAADASTNDPWRFTLAPALLAAIAAIALGVEPSLLLRAADAAAAILTGAPT